MENKIDFITFELIKKGMKNLSQKKILDFAENVLHIRLGKYEAEFILSHYSY